MSSRMTREFSKYSRMRETRSRSKSRLSGRKVSQTTEKLNIYVEFNEQLSQNYKHRVGSFISKMILKPKKIDDEFINTRKAVP